MSRKTILFISVNDRCYASYRFFAARLAEAVEKKGVQADWCYLPEGSGKDMESWNRVLQEVLGKTYLAVVDFNSFLPKLQADGKNMIDLFEAPFYHIVLDHPLYHHAALSAETDLQRIICVDERHAAYVQANYPRIKEVWTHTIPGTKGALADTPFQERKHEILFCGTYEDPQQYWELMKELPVGLKKECRLLAEQMLAFPERTMEELLAGLSGSVDLELARKQGIASLETVLRRENVPVESPQKRKDAFGEPAGGQGEVPAKSIRTGGGATRFAARMQANFLADAYVRNLRRKQVVEAMVKEKLPLALYGQGWEALGAKAEGRLSYENYVNQIGAYRFALHCMPGFVCGGHDRIGNAMSNGAVCISDRTQYTRSRYEQGEAIYIGYETGQPDSLTEQCGYYLSHAEEAEAIADAGRRFAEGHGTWEQFAEKLVAHAEGEVLEGH